MIKKQFVLFILLGCSGFCCAAAEDKNVSELKWTKRDVNSVLDYNIQAAFCGGLNNCFIIAGGFDLKKNFTGTTYIYDNSSSQWYIEPNIVFLGYGASVVNGDSLLCIGGLNENGPEDKVIELRWDNKTKHVVKKVLPSLPHNLAYASAAVSQNTLFVFGGYKDSESKPSSEVWLLDLKAGNNSKWQKFPNLPDARCVSAAIAQTKGDSQCLYVFGGKSSLQANALNDGCYYDLDVEKKKSGWTKIRDLPFSIQNTAVINFGQSSIFLFDTIQKKLLSYNTITDSWIILGKLPNEIKEQIAVNISQNKISMLSLNASLDECELKSAQGYIKFLDYAAIIFYFAILIGIGIYFSKKESTTEDFFLGGRNIPWWVAGISLLATQVSSIGFMAVPAKAYATNWLYLGTVLTWFVAVPIVNRFYLPFFHSMAVSTAYEYLELRFSVVLRMFASLLFCFMMLARMSIVLYLPALALAAVTGIDQYLCIAVMGIISTIYTTMGGVKAVLWTDVLQVMLMMGSIVVCVFIVMFSVDGGPVSFFSTAVKYNKLQIVRWDWDITSASIGIVLVGSIFSKLASLTSDQSLVQRYSSTKSKHEAVRSLWTDVAISIPWAIIVFLFGTALFVYYHSMPQKLSPTISNDAIVPWFISHGLPVGVAGLVIAGLFSAAQSAFSGALNSVTMSIVTDFYKRFTKSSAERTMIILARILTILLGIFSTGSAMLMAHSGIHSIWDFFIGITGLFAGGLGGLFALGVFTIRTNAVGALVGVLSSGILLFFIQTFNVVHLLLYCAIGFIWCFTVGYLFSLVAGKKKEDLYGLTYYTRRKDDI